MALPFSSCHREACAGRGSVGPLSEHGTVEKSALPQDFLCTLQIFLRIYTHGVVLCFADIDRDSVFEETQLLQPFGFFQSRFRPAHKKIEGGFPVGIEAKMLEVASAGVVAVEGDRGPGKIESAAAWGGHDFDRVGIVDFFWRARSLDCSRLDRRV